MEKYQIIISKILFPNLWIGIWFALVFFEKEGLRNIYYIYNYIYNIYPCYFSKYTSIYFSLKKTRDDRWRTGDPTSWSSHQRRTWPSWTPSRTGLNEVKGVSGFQRFVQWKKQHVVCILYIYIYIYILYLRYYIDIKGLWWWNVLIACMIGMILLQNSGAFLLHLIKLMVGLFFVVGL